MDPSSRDLGIRDAAGPDTPLPTPGVTIDAVELRRIELPLVAPFRTSFGTWEARDVLFVRVLGTGPSGVVEGWGECVAGARPDYSEEYTAGCEAVARDVLVPLLFAADVRHGGDVAGVLEPVRGNRMAKAAVEAAVLDAELRAAGVSLADHLGAAVDRVPVGVAIGVHDDLDELVAVARRHVDEGYTRLKVKIEPGWDVEPLGALRAALGDGVGLQADANGSYPADDPAALRALDRFDLLMIEQPFDRDLLVDHVALAEAIETPVCLDETLVSREVARDAVRLGATSIVTVKPGRLGGHLAGKAVHDDCVSAGVPVWHGGMLETGIGRAANLALASLPGFTLPGDISAADRYWRRDVVTTPAVLEPDGTIRVPTGPGTGVEVDLDVLAGVTTSVSMHEAP